MREVENIGEIMVNVLKLDIKINKDKIYKNLHLDGIDLSGRIDDIFRELTQIIKDNMKLTCIYSIIDNTYSLPLFHTVDCNRWNKYVLCFISSTDNLDNIISEMMSSGDYLKGYILNEISIDVIFNASDEMNKIIKSEATRQGYRLSKRYAPGDGTLDLVHQKTILEALKKTTNIDAYLTDAYMLFPEKSLLYFYGVFDNEITSKSICSMSQPSEEIIKDENIDEYKEIDENCSECSNINCQYRKLR